MISNYLVLVILIPLIVSVINFFVPKIVKKVLAFVGGIFSLYFSIRIFALGGIDFGITDVILLQSDMLSNFILLFVNVLSFIIFIYCLKNVNPEFESRFFVLFPMALSFCNGVAVSANIFVFLAFWGLSGLMLLLFALLKGREAAESARKTIIIVGGSDVLLIIGLGILYQFTQQTNLFSINVILGNPLSYIAFFFLLLAAFAKAGAFPMHTWVPDFAKDAPIESVAFLPAAMDKLLGIYLVARIMMDIFRVPFFINGIVMILGALTVITAVMMALVQHNGRKLLGYHAVSQVGYMVLGIGTGTPIGIIGGIFHMLNNAIYKSNLFLSFGSVEKRTGTAELDEMGGLARVMPFTFVSALIGALSISGIPPFNGFFSKWMVYQGVLETSSSAGAGWQVVTNICLVLAVFGSALTLASFMKFLHSIFLSKMPEKFKGIKEISFNNWFATILLSTLCVVFGLFVFAVPIRFILPILGPEVTIDSILWSFYQPGPVVLLFAVAILVGIILYLVFRKVRFDEEYIGGMTATEENRITGVEFYNEVKEIAPFKKIYAMAEKKYFDIYDIGTNFSLWFGNIFHKLHTGLLHTYAIWTLIGFVILAIILVSAIW